MSHFTLEPVQNISSFHAEIIEISDGDSIIVGRPSKNANHDVEKFISISDRRLSSKHFTLHCKDKELYITDNSTNGVFLNGKRIGRGNTEKIQENDILTCVAPSINHPAAHDLPCWKVISHIEKEDVDDSTQVIDEDLSNVFDTEPVNNAKSEEIVCPNKSLNYREENESLQKQIDPMESNITEFERNDEQKDQEMVCNDPTTTSDNVPSENIVPSEFVHVNTHAEPDQKLEANITDTSSKVDVENIDEIQVNHPSQGDTNESRKRKRESQLEEEHPNKIAKMNSTSTNIPAGDSEQSITICKDSDNIDKADTESVQTNLAQTNSPQNDPAKNTNDEAPTQKDESNPSKYDEETLRIMKLMGATDEDLDKEDGNDEFAEELQCGICSDVLYQPVSLIPCLHTFCAPCYSQWMEDSDTCPHCRDEVKTIRKHHQLMNLVQKYLDKHPEKKRSDEEIAELEQKNTLTDDKLRELANQQPTLGSNLSTTNTFSFQPLVPQYFAPRNNVCRECHTPGRDGFICSNYQTHVTCQACQTYFPLRGFSGCGRAQRCLYCSDFYCEQYFGSCPQSNRIRFVQLKDHVISQIPTNALASNSVELDILLDYMRSNNITPQNVYSTICTKLGNGEWSLELSNVTVRPTDYACTNCANIVLEKMIYNYRKSIPQSQLPLSVTNKPNCHYGIECWTAKRNLAHAQRYNHICENTKRR